MLRQCSQCFAIRLGCQASLGKSLTALVVYVDAVSDELHVLLDKTYVKERRRWQVQSVSSQVHGVAYPFVPFIVDTQYVNT